MIEEKIAVLGTAVVVKPFKEPHRTTSSPSSQTKTQGKHPFVGPMDQLGPQRKAPWRKAHPASLSWCTVQLWAYREGSQKCSQIKQQQLLEERLSACRRPGGLPLVCISGQLWTSLPQHCCLRKAGFGQNGPGMSTMLWCESYLGKAVLEEIQQTMGEPICGRNN